MSPKAKRKAIFNLAVRTCEQTGCKYREAIEKALSTYNMTWTDLRALVSET